METKGGVSISKLRELRETNGFKQEEIARLLGTSLPNYSKKENGDIKFSLKEAKKIADFFKMTVEEVFFT